MWTPFEVIVGLRSARGKRQGNLRRRVVVVACWIGYVFVLADRRGWGYSGRDRCACLIGGAFKETVRQRRWGLSSSASSRLLKYPEAPAELKTTRPPSSSQGIDQESRKCRLKGSCYLSNYVCDVFRVDVRSDGATAIYCRTVHVDNDTCKIQSRCVRWISSGLSALESKIDGVGGAVTAGAEIDVEAGCMYVYRGIWGRCGRIRDGGASAHCTMMMITLPMHPD